VSALCIFQFIDVGSVMTEWLQSGYTDQIEYCITVVYNVLYSYSKQVLIINNFNVIHIEICTLDALLKVHLHV